MRWTDGKPALCVIEIYCPLFPNFAAAVVHATCIRGPTVNGRVGGLQRRDPESG
jgi:hypothetical protein